MSLSELQDRFLENENKKKRCAVMFDLSCKLLQFLENMSSTCPSAFVEQLTMVRLSELILGALSCVSKEGSHGELFQNSIRKIKRGSTPENLEYGVYGPVAGIITKLSSNECSFELGILDSLASVDANSDLKSFNGLFAYAWEKSIQTSPDGIERDVPKLNNVRVVLTEKYAAKEVATKDNDDDDENLCSICYGYDIDTVFIPCNHRSCNQCITRHLLDNKKCFFCNTEIERIEPIKDDNDDQS